MHACTQGDDRPEDRVVALLNLYNATSAPTGQHAVLLSAAEFSRRNPTVSPLLGGAVKGKVDTWVKEWNLSEAQTRELILALAYVMKVRVRVRAAGAVCGPAAQHLPAACTHGC